jgi:integrase
VGILALLHGASSSEVRRLLISHVDAGDRTARLGKRRHPVPLTRSAGKSCNVAWPTATASTPPSRT